MLRNWIREDKSVRYYIPDPVIEYIRENQIYSLAEKKGWSSDGRVWFYKNAEKN